jgi:NAD-dependent deacetylase
MDKRLKSEADLPEEIWEAVQRAAEIISVAQQGVVLTGAGISTPSGIPDFRSQDSGLWTRYDPMEVASLRTFRYAPEQFYRWLQPLVIKLFNAEPNPAHIAVAQLEQAGHVNTVITQNIDDLHQRAGSSNVLQVHGSLDTLTCVRCFRQTRSSAVIEPYLESGEVPRCPHCDGILKPDVILVEEQLPVETWRKAEKAIRESDMLLVIGSSLEMMPVAGLPLRAVERNIPLIILNYTPTYIDVRASVVLHEEVAEYLPIIVEETLLAQS